MQRGDPGSSGRQVDWAMVRLNLLAVVVCLFALLMAAAARVAASFSVLAPPEGPREWFIEDQQAAVSQWALVTAVGVVVARLYPRLVPLVVGAWSVALVMATPWAWPDSLGSRRLRLEPTIWREHWELLGAFVLLSVLFGWTLGWRGGRRARAFTALMTMWVLLLVTLSTLLVLRAQAAERTSLDRAISTGSIGQSIGLLDQRVLSREYHPF